MDDLKSYAIIMIHEDGLIEKIKVDNRKFHMQYMVSLINRSKKLSELVNKSDFYLPMSDMEAELTLTYETDKFLSENGIVIIHNLYVDEELEDEFSDYAKDFYVTMPSELSIEQKNVLKNIINKFDMSSCWYSKYMDDKLIDINYEDAVDMINDKIK